jgi:hypothetical protein
MDLLVVVTSVLGHAEFTVEFATDLTAILNFRPWMLMAKELLWLDCKATL